MRLLVVAVGRIKDRALRAVIDDYLGRVRRMVPCDELELPPGPPAKLAAQLKRAAAGAKADSSIYLTSRR